MRSVLVSVQANIGIADVMHASASGRNQNEHRTRQAIRGLRDMFRKDGLLK